MNRRKEAVYQKVGISRQGLPVLLGVLVILGLSIGAVRPAEGARFNWKADTELVLTPAGSSLLGDDSRTTWGVDYLEGNLTDYPDKMSTALFWPNTNNRLFDTGLALSGDLEIPFDLEGQNVNFVTLDGYFAKGFGQDYQIGTYGGSSKITFNREELNYWVTKGIVNYGGFSYIGTFLLERDPKTGNYGSGLELALTGMKVSGVSVEIKTRLGMLPDPPEMIGDNLGSGYDVFTPNGEKLSGYTASEITLENVSFGPLKLDSTSRFNFKGGFEGTSFDFTMEEENFPLEMEGKAVFGPDDKSVSLTPELDLEWANFDVTTSVSSGKITESEDVISGLVIEGIGVEEVGLGTGEGSLKLGIGDHKLWRRSSTEDYQLRASDYVFSSTAESEFSYQAQSIAWEETNHSGVFSLEGGGGNLYLAIDAYWGSDPGLFGFTELTGEAEYRLSEELELTTGISLTSGEGLEKLAVNTVLSW